MTAIPAIDILSDIEALQLKINTAIAAAQVIEADTTNDARIIADATERIAVLTAYREKALEFYDVA